jgi:hypothetical protein
VYAQSVIEYGALTAWLSSAVQQLAFIRDWLGHPTPMTWLVIGVVLLAAFLLWRRP